MPAKKFALSASFLALASVVLLHLGNVAPLRAQSPAADWEKAAGGKMSFEVASIKRHPYDPASRYYMPHRNFPLSSDDQYAETGGLMSTENIPARTYISFAYKLGTHQSIQALPKWADDEHFDIQARGPANATKDQMRLMMQSLLADRFKLAVHWEDKEIPMFSVVLAKAGKTGPQLQPSSEGPCVMSPHDGPPKNPNEVSCGVGGMQYLENGEYEVIGHYKTMQQISPDLADWPGTGVDRPLMDGTGLAGMFDFKLVWEPEPTPGQQPQDAASGPSYLDALRDQLGLKLVSTTGPWRYLAIDHIEEPTPN